MENRELHHFLEFVGKDPVRLIFEDEITSIYNRRYLHHYLEFKIPLDSEEDYPLSIIMLDMDHFKEINDTYGHQMGDAALVWIAKIIKDVAGEDGIPIRYAGDEFMILLPYQEKSVALKKGEQLLQWVRSEPFRHKDLDGALNLTFSIGIASVPMNRKDVKDLTRKADTALYYAKKTGRDCLADFENLDKEVVFTKTATNQLDEIKIVGRQKQLQQIAEALKKFTQKQSQFLIIEGAAGMGKSLFLEEIHDNLNRNKIFTVKTKGIPQEMFRPYYTMTNILIAILNQQEDKGTRVLKTLTKEEIAYLSNFLPMGGEEKAAPSKSKKIDRKGIFNALIRFFVKLINKRPLAIFIDDLHYTDEATLLIFRQLILKGKIPLFICTTSPESFDLKKDNQTHSLERFYKTYSQELDIRKISLTPFTESDIANHIKGIFPNVHLSESILKELTKITHGNPLFLGEILRKLVQNEKIVLIGHEWLILPLEDDYLPKSLEDIVSQKISALDEENRQLLEEVSALGPNVPLSVLIGSSGKMESQVLEFIDQAKSQGLISSEFQLNDESINFLSKCILEITYGSIEEDRKLEIHKQIGDYQETLFKKKLLPSVATLAYHFKRSTDQKSTQKYEQLLAKWRTKIFNAKEAVKYEAEVEESEGFIDEEVPLDPACLEKVPNIIRYLLNAVRNFKLYPKGSQSTINAIKQLEQGIDQVLQNTNFFNIVEKRQTLVVNTQEIDISEFESLAHNFIDFMHRFDLKSIGFRKGLTDYELEVLLDGFCVIKADVIDPGFWQHFFTEHNEITHIRLEQVRYTKKKVQSDYEIDAKILEHSDSESPGELFSQLLGGDQELDKEESDQVITIIRSLLKASRNIKLYPLESKVISDSIQQLMETLQSFLTRQPILSLACVNKSLLVNGKKINTSVFGMLATSFLKFLETSTIKSLSFLQYITLQELQTFIGSLAQLPNAPSDDNFWERFCEDNKLSGILLNKDLYEILDSIRDAGSKEVLKEGVSKGEKADTHTEEAFDIFLKEIKERLSDLLLKDDWNKLQKTLKQLFKGFHDREIIERKRVIGFCQDMLENLTLIAKCRLSELMTNHILDVFSEEKAPDILVNIASLLKHMINSFIQFAEYQSASKLVFHLQNYHRQINEGEKGHIPLLSEAMDIRLEPTIQRLIMDDLKSSDPSRQKDTTQLLEVLGETAIPLLIDIIKREEDYRARKIASVLLEELTPEAGNVLKQELFQEIDADERIRILEIIDNLNTDLKDDLVFILGDRNPKVRKAAFQLAERLNDQYVVELLLDYARNKETDLATAAIKSLGRLKIQTVGEKILSLLDSTKEEERLIAICRALGQIGDPSCIEPLAKILAPKSFFRFNRKPSPQVRTAAAYALSRISHTKGAEMLKPFVEDPDPGLRHIVEKTIEKAKSSSSS